MASQTKAAGSAGRSACAKAGRKAVYPWLVKWLALKFGVDAAAQTQHFDAAMIDFASLRNEMLASEMPGEVRASIDHVRVRHIKEQYVRSVLYPKRAGTMPPHERELVTKFAKEHIESHTTPKGIVEWRRLAEKLRAATGIMISEGNLKNMLRSALVSPRKGSGGGAKDCPENDAPKTQTPRNAPKSRIPSNAPCAEPGKSFRGTKALEERRPPKIRGVQPFEPVEGLTPASIVRHVDRYLRELAREC
jgi:hypothetical protein